MSLLEQLNTEIKEAMKAKDKDTLSVLRMLKAAVQNEQIANGHDLTEEEALTVLSREMKQRRDAHKEFEAAGRNDLADKLVTEMKVIEKYLPKQLTESEIRDIVEKAVQQVSASGMHDFGKVMGVVMPQVKGVADGNQVNAIVKELLNK